MNCKPCSNEYFQLSLTLPSISKEALPGQYIVINKKHSLYIMGNDPNIEVIVPKSLKEEYEQGIFSNIELHGTPLQSPDPTQFNLLLAENDGLSACLFYLRKYRKHFNGLVLIGTNQYFPFNPCPSKHLLFGMPPEVTGALPLLDDWKIAHRLASHLEMPGVYHGSVNDLAKEWLEKSQPSSINPILKKL